MGRSGDFGIFYSRRDDAVGSPAHCEIRTRAEGLLWVLNTMYPENPIIDGWLGWVVKIATGVMLAALAAYFFIVRKKEVEEFKASKEPKKTSMYEKYDDYDYSASENKEAEGTEDSASK